MAGSLDAESVIHAFVLGSDEAPAEARWMQAPGMGEFAFGYDAARASSDPKATLRSFLRTPLEARAEAGRWDRALLEQ